MLICVNYHYIRDSFEAKHPSIFGIQPDAFERQLEALSKIGKFISAEDLATAIINGKGLEGNNVLITFDDGLKEQMNLAVPILNRMGIPAIFFANSASFTEKRVESVHKIHLVRSVLSPKDLLRMVDNHLPEMTPLEISVIRAKGIKHYKYDTEDTAELKYLLNFILEKNQLQEFIDHAFQMAFNEVTVNEELYMSIDDITKLAHQGQLGSHGYTHVPMGLQDMSTKRKEIVGSAEMFKNLTGFQPIGFSFPYGSLNSAEGCKDYLVEGDYVFALTMERSINPDLTQPFGLSRFDNNDMPLGKSFPFQNHMDVFNYPMRSWEIQN
jgi:peptidoglycan/xylan/chitin deacetylase (PgdA/CDA1 family)